MREIRTSGLTSGDGKRDGLATPALALDSTGPTSPSELFVVCDEPRSVWSELVKM